MGLAIDQREPLSCARVTSSYRWVEWGTVIFHPHVWSCLDLGFPRDQIVGHYCGPSSSVKGARTIRAGRELSSLFQSNSRSRPRTRHHREWVAVRPPAARALARFAHIHLKGCHLADCEGQVSGRNVPERMAAARASKTRSVAPQSANGFLIVGLKFAGCP